MSTTIITSDVAKGWAPDGYTFAPSDAIPEAIILQAAINSGKIEGDAPALRVAYVDDGAATFTAEGEALTVENPGLDEVLVYTGKITQLVRLSREQYTQQATANQLAESVKRAIVKKADQAFLNQAAPTSPAVTPPAGLLNIDGIETGSPITSDLDPLIDLVAGLEGNGATPGLIVLDPVGWAALRKIRTQTGSNQSLLGAGTTDAERMLLDLPVRVTSAMPANTGLVIDPNAVAAALGTVEVKTSEHVFFTSDSIGVLAFWRIGWNLVHPDRVGTFTITTE